MLNDIDILHLRAAWDGTLNSMLRAAYDKACEDCAVEIAEDIHEDGSADTNQAYQNAFEHCMSLKHTEGE